MEELQQTADKTRALTNECARAIHDNPFSAAMTKILGAAKEGNSFVSISYLPHGTQDTLLSLGYTVERNLTLGFIVRW